VNLVLHPLTRVWLEDLVFHLLRTRVWLVAKVHLVLHLLTRVWLVAKVHLVLHLLTRVWLVAAVR
jgi:hypothetical protein